MVDFEFPGLVEKHEFHFQAAELPLSTIMISTPEAITIAELCIYTPIFLLTAVLLFRHGFKRQSGWIYLAIFCLVRIVGATFKIESTKNPRSKTDLEWSAILQSVGLSPLLLASLGLLKRVTDSASDRVRSDEGQVNRNNFGLKGRGRLSGRLISKYATANSKRSRVIQLAQIPILVGLVLCIIGGTDIAGGDPKGTTLTKVGIIIFAVAYVLHAALLGITSRDVGNIPRGERRLYWVLVSALPSLGVRLLWSLLAVFAHLKRFAIEGGNSWVNFGMAVVMEFIIVCLYTATGFTLGQADEL